MGKPVARTEGICMAMPDICLTPAPPAPPVPIPYPNIAQLSGATGTAATVNAGGKPVIVESSEIPTSSGDEAGTAGGQTSGTFLQKCTFAGFSGTVKAEGKGIVRQLDATRQNNGNADGVVMTGFPTVLVGD